MVVDVVEHDHLTPLHAINKLYQDMLVFFDQVLLVVHMYPVPFQIQIDFKKINKKKKTSAYTIGTARS
jgi:hypothetical protein